jgi:hypothetical protein
LLFFKLYGLQILEEIFNFFLLKSYLITIMITILYYFIIVLKIYYKLTLASHKHLVLSVAQSANPVYPFTSLTCLSSEVTGSVQGMATQCA